MPKAVFQEIYKAIKKDIESGTYPYESLIPSENELCQIFSCSRSSIRRALSQLTQEGYIQPMHGKGVRVIYSPAVDKHFATGPLESFKEVAQRRGFDARTETLVFETIVADEKLAQITGFRVGSSLLHLLRLRYAGQERVGTDESYYLSNTVEGLTPEKANNSIYDFLEKEAGLTIVTSKRRICVERASKQDKKYIDLHNLAAVAVLRCNAYDSNGIMIEYTETRQNADFFQLENIATRTR